MTSQHKFVFCTLPWYRYHYTRNFVCVQHFNDHISFHDEHAFLQSVYSINILVDWISLISFIHSVILPIDDNNYLQNDQYVTINRYEKICSRCQHHFQVHKSKCNISWTENDSIYDHFWLCHSISNEFALFYKVFEEYIARLESCNTKLDKFNGDLRRHPELAMTKYAQFMIHYLDGKSMNTKKFKRKRVWYDVDFAQFNA